MNEPKIHGVRWVKGRPYARLRVGKDVLSVSLAHCKTEAAIAARRAIIFAQVQRLMACGRGDKAHACAQALGGARTERELRLAVQAVDVVCTESAALEPGETTVKDLGDRWTSGDLARRHPDHVRVKSSVGRDKELLKLYVYPVIGDMPVAAVKLVDIERVMGRIPALNPRRKSDPRPLAVATRRHIAQVMHRIFKLACYPLKLIHTSPIPVGFLPKVHGSKARQYLYPEEDAKLLACTAIPLVYRVFYGFVAREGPRYGEAAGLAWSDLDLERGALRLDDNKTDEPRTWALDPSVTAALKRWKELRKLPSPFAGLPADERQAFRFREHLLLAGVDRTELHETTETRSRVRVHDLRATFVTLSLATGKTETWVSDRTGHKSSVMIARYKRAARTLLELGVGRLRNLDEAITWTDEQQASSGCQPAEPENQETPCTEGGTRTLMPFRTADFESGGIVLDCDRLSSGDVSPDHAIHSDPKADPQDRAVQITDHDAPGARHETTPQSRVDTTVDPSARSVDALTRVADGLRALAAVSADLDAFSAAAERDEEGST